MLTRKQVELELLHCLILTEECAQHEAYRQITENDTLQNKCEQSLYGHMHSINDATFSPRGHMIASCDACGVIKLWDFRKLLPIVSIDVGPSPANEVKFDSTGRIFLFNICDKGSKVKTCSETIVFPLFFWGVGMSSYVRFCF
ncbi:Sperm-associated antigen 16 protein [Tupaia chinensis]|uniref:Sperm-associated antigen 16 protein n=1 Tax=Tupaia chinensis TaxID=246437 RepID=L9LCR7_TUPCH|nr:Sperm-associated antigen 16 protein [Tupaia chinensis]